MSFMSFEMGTKEDPQVHTRHLVQVAERYRLIEKDTTHLNIQQEMWKSTYFRLCTQQDVGNKKGTPPFFS